MDEELVLVDEQDNQVGTAGKLECHIGAGKLHRAFTALVFDGSGRLLLTRRSDSKMLWPGIWDATFASHPRVAESYADSAVRRMPDELGASCRMEYLFKFVYHVKYADVGAENEVCGTLIGTLKDASVKPVEGEISEVSWKTCNDIISEIKTDVKSYCPWMLIALWMLGQQRNSDVYGSYAKAIEPWTNPDTRDALAASIRAHMDDSQWREVSS